MVRVKCEDVTLDDEKTLQQWLLSKHDFSIKKVHSVDRRTWLKIVDSNQNEAIVRPDSFSSRALRRLGCKEVVADSHDDVVRIFESCSASISSDRKELVFDFVPQAGYEIRLKIDHFPAQILGSSFSDATFGSAKEAIDNVDKNNTVDSVYSHIPIRVDNCTKFVDLRDVNCDFSEDLEDSYQFDLETYYRSLTFWIACNDDDDDDGGVLPFRHETDTTLLLPVPPAVRIPFVVFCFTDNDFRVGDNIQPSTQFGHWKEDTDGPIYCLAYKGKPFVFDKSKNVTRRLILWNDLKDESFERLLKEAGWPVDESTLFRKSFETCFAVTQPMFECEPRCRISYEKCNQRWTAMVPKANVK